MTLRPARGAKFKFNFTFPVQTSFSKFRRTLAGFRTENGCVFAAWSKRLRLRGSCLPVPGLRSASGLRVKPGVDFREPAGEGRSDGPSIGSMLRMGGGGGKLDMMMCLLLNLGARGLFFRYSCNSYVKVRLRPA